MENWNGFARRVLSPSTSPRPEDLDELGRVARAKGSGQRFARDKFARGKSVEKDGILGKPGWLNGDWLDG